MLLIIERNVKIKAMLQNDQVIDEGVKPCCPTKGVCISSTISANHLALATTTEQMQNLLPRNATDWLMCMPCDI